jgi:hypothetical protein
MRRWVRRIPPRKRRGAVVVPVAGPMVTLLTVLPFAQADVGGDADGYGVIVGEAEFMRGSLRFHANESPASRTLVPPRPPSSIKQDRPQTRRRSKYGSGQCSCPEDPRAARRLRSE